MKRSAGGARLGAAGLAGIVAAATLAGVAAATPAPMCDGEVATIVLGGGDDDVLGTPGDDVVVLGGGNDYYHGDAGGHDTVCGGPGNDDIRTGAGNDTVLAGTGNDIVANGTGRNRTSGGAGLDELDFDVASGITLDLTARTATGAVNDAFSSVEVFQGTPGDDKVLGSDRSDTFRSTEGRDRVWGADGDDSLSVAGNAVVRAGRGADLVFAQGAATAYGGDGRDRFLVESGSPRVLGQQGDDYFTFQFPATPTVDGGEGSDRLSLATLTAALTLDLTAGTGAAGLLGFTVASLEEVVGTPFADSISGDQRANRLSGRGGLDDLRGRAGDDVLLGGTDDDTAHGGAGSDRCVAETVSRCES